jgi:MFS family permease
MTQAVAQAWLVLRLGGHGLVLGAVTACTFAPLLVGGAWAGALVDRVDRRDVLLATQTSFVLISSTLGILTLLDVVRLWMVFVGALAAGCVNAFDQPARQIYVLEIVGRERTANAIGLNEVVINASRVLGPAAGGLLLVLSGVTGCFFFNAATFVPPLLVLWHFRPAEKAPNRPRRPGRTREGLRYVWGQPAIRSTLVMAAASGMLFNLSVALPLVATRVFRLGGGGYGLMLSAFGLGALGGAVLAAIGSSWPSGRTVRLLALVSGVAVILTAGSPDVGAAFAGLAICGFCSIWFIARANALAQLRAAPDMRGRVMGLWTMALPGMNPVTAPLVGLVCDDLGPRQGFGLAGVALVLAAGMAWRALGDSPAASGAAVAVAGP